MRLYQDKLFPFLLDRVMRSDALVEFRKQCLQGLEGEVVEIGFGTGLNLPFYPEGVCHVYGVDIADSLFEYAKKETERFSGQVTLHLTDGVQLPFGSNSQTQVVVTWSLCSVHNLEGLLHEIHRILVPGGVLRFVEHGLSDKKGTAKLQNWLTPIHKKVAGGCCLNRNFYEILPLNGLFEVKIKTTNASKIPFLLNPLYHGECVKRGTSS